MSRLLFIIFTVLCMNHLKAAIEVYQFDFSEQEERFHQLSDQLRCPMCLNSNLSGSDAPIAADLRAEIYEQIIDGRTNDEIIDFMTQRYGDFINYRPPLNQGTVLLWFGPLVLLLVGLLIVWRMAISNQAVDQARSLTAEEQKKLEKILTGKK
jgi:cytochrome c-type biogenesis protein CcmH